jgi:hypothetical protein
LTTDLLATSLVLVLIILSVYSFKTWNEQFTLLFSSSGSFCCNWCDPVSVVSAHYDSRFAWLLLIQQSRPALKLLTVFALTTSLGKLFHKLDERLKKKFSR